MNDEERWISIAQLNEVLDSIAAWYPLDVFPEIEPGCAVDRYTAAGCRITIKNVRELAREYVEAHPS